MNIDEQLIERLAAAAGWRVDSFTNNNGRRLIGLTPANLEQVKRFAQLVAAQAAEAEREACAKACERRPLMSGLDEWDSAAAAIRNRGNA